MRSYPENGLLSYQGRINKCMTVAYIYKWTHVPTSKWYIGVRSKSGCHPNDGYICSSKIVKPLIKASPSEWIREILHTGSPSDMISLESAILESLDARNDENSYNLHNGDGKFSTAEMRLPDCWIEKIKKSNSGKTRSEAARENYRRANQEKAKDPSYIAKLRKPKPPGFGAKVSAATKGISKTPEHRRALSESLKGKKRGPCPENRRESIKRALAGKHTLPLVTCPHCGLVGRANMKRWHFDNCKNKAS